MMRKDAQDFPPIGSLTRRRGRTLLQSAFVARRLSGVLHLRIHDGGRWWCLVLYKGC